MPRKRQSVSDTVSWLSFPRQTYPNFYLNTERIRHRFHGYHGSITQFSETVEKSGEVNASVKALFLDAGISRGHGGNVEIAWDVADPLPQALVLRAHLATAGELQADARSAPMTDFVLARGQGGIIQPLHVADSSFWSEGEVSPGVVSEIVAEQQRQAAIGTSADPEPLYWAAYANTDRGLVVSLLGDASLIDTDVRSYAGLDMTYCIFGQKLRDWQSWTLLSPLHVWVEPPGTANWG
ncbi:MULTISPECIES: hypothetical protein [unclassified Streptomyces]|uniref:hypothetical protein n=1 Tax=unclassified Streptomyces TaxID=2593676 RepID=UPI0022588D93|nr:MULTISPECIES: hypothetical protein [unclassified Streptomyces]MCX5327872.1 hypothetical protein [Streptomyces sp. NBC_00140]MCX5357361.1 hypothetical protein [Streptomyces sp. NBC_00124]